MAGDEQVVLAELVDEQLPDLALGLVGEPGCSGSVMGTASGCHGRPTRWVSRNPGASTRRPGREDPRRHGARTRNGRTRTAINDPERTIPIGPWRVNRAKLLVRRRNWLWPADIRSGCRLPSVSEGRPDREVRRRPAPPRRGARRSLGVPARGMTRGHPLGMRPCPARMLGPKHPVPQPRPWRPVRREPQQRKGREQPRDSVPPEARQARASRH